MARDDDAFLAKLLETFREEAREHMEAMSRELLALEKATGQEERTEATERLFRDVHSLKGASRAVRMLDMEKVCQAMEERLSELKRGEAKPSGELIDAFHDGIRLLEQIPLSPDADPGGEVHAGIESLLSSLQGASDASCSEAKPSPRPEATPEPPDKPLTAVASTNSVRVATGKLDSLLYMAEELIPEKLVADQRAADLWELNARVGEWRKRWAKARSMRAAAARPEHASQRVAGRNTDSSTENFLNWSRSTLEGLEVSLRKLARTADEDRRKLSSSVDELVESTKKILVQPFSTILDIVPRMVRDLARELEKKVEVSIEGGDVEVDRRILEMMKDPLIHLIRNAVDHGIELSGERRRHGKPEIGSIHVRVSQLDSGWVELTISDDGAGVAIEAVRAMANRSGIASAEELAQMENSEALRLIFRSGLTTSKIISDISGRGLGLPILEEQVQKLGGDIGVASEAGKGTNFTIRLPVTLAALRGTLVKVRNHVMAVPSTNIERVIQVRAEDVSTMENFETVRVNGDSVSLVRMDEILDLGADRETDALQATPSRPALLLGSAGQRVACLVDGFAGEQEIRVKPLGAQLQRVRNVSGVTQLGTGRLIPVLNVTDLLRSALRATRPRPSAAGERTSAQRSILIAEDSVTSRVLLETILEAAGYKVKAAADGLSAYTALQQEAFDLVVSDVEMPHMDGFELTQRIREDDRTAELPVVLVTSLSSTDDRKRGIEVGANAYIVKSEFEQSDLLRVIENLI
ncbi:MAG: response regulator [Gammaproteobacteria bacterium]|nr:response regulator [Gammaproteobacteria bacterium]